MTTIARPLKPAFQIDSVTASPKSVHIRWQDGHESLYHKLWLRDSCRCPNCFQRDTLSLNSGHDPLRIPLNPVTQDVKMSADGNLQIVWGGQEQGHHSEFDASWLRVHGYDDPLLQQPRQPRLWDASIDIPRFDYEEVMYDDDALLQWLEYMIELGVVIIDGMPTDQEHYVALVDRVGPTRQRYHPTNIFTLNTADDNAKKIQAAYQLEHLKNHSDVTAYQIPTGLQFLGCIKYEHSGQEDQGLSTVVDGFKIAEVIRTEHPDYFELLTREYIPAGRRRLSVEEKLNANESSARKYEWEAYRHNHVISLDERGEVYQIRYNHNTRIPLTVSYDKIEGLLAAYREFSRLLESPEYVAKFLLAPGQVYVVHNWRVLHGRTAVWDASLRRTVLGAYLEEETFRSRRRILLGSKTGMSDVWLMGCSDRALEVLTERYE